MDIETGLNVLSVTTDALTTPCTLDDALNRITTMTSTILGTSQAAILLRDEEREEFVVRACRGVDDQKVRVGHTLQVAERLKRILWRARSARQIGWLETGIEDLGFPMMFVPLRIKGERIGLLLTGVPEDGGRARFSPAERQLLVLVASVSSLVLENAKVYDYLRQRFAQRAHDLIEDNRREANGKNEEERLMISSISNPNKVVRLLASSFYKELVRAGFSPGHITTAAAEILDCITRQQEV